MAGDRVVAEGHGTEAAARWRRMLDDPRLGAWHAFLVAQSALLRTLEAELVADQDLSLAEYDALVRLAVAPDRRLRMSELADRLVISRSGATRLVDRLVDRGLACRSACPPDGRGAYAVLTAAGRSRLREAVPVHLDHIDRHFLAQVSPDDLPALERAMTAVAVATGRDPAEHAWGLEAQLDDDLPLEDR